MYLLLFSRTLILSIIGILTVASPAAAATQRILVDESHAQAFRIDQETPLGLSRAATVLNEAGYRLSASSAALTPDALQGVDMLLISGPFKPFSPAEIATIVDYLKQGGGLALFLHIAPPAGGLLNAIGVNFSNGVIRERENVIDGEPLNFSVTRLTPHPALGNLTSFEAYGAWAIIPMGENATVIGQTGDTAWVDLDKSKTFTPGDAVQSLPVLIAGTLGKGRFVVAGDDAIFQNTFLSENNASLLRSLTTWLAGQP